MRVLYGLALFLGIAVVLLMLIAAAGAVGSIELLLVIVLAAAISMLATSRSWGRRRTAPRS
jgi:hypothetical protein